MDDSAVIRVRLAHPLDAKQYTRLLKDLDQESSFPVVGSFERVMTAAHWQGVLARAAAARASAYFVAADGDELVGFLNATAQPRRDLCELGVVIGLRATHRRQGIGTRLFAALFDWARASGVQRLSLRVEANNLAARGLYEKLGFVVEEVIPQAVWIGGRLVDDLVMARWLELEGRDGFQPG